jgi:hypothetical protein
MTTAQDFGALVGVVFPCAVANRADAQIITKATMSSAKILPKHFMTT